MATKCLTPVKGRALRVTRLDGCGRPVYGECSVAVSKTFVSVALTANTTDSDEINVTNAAGERCVYQPAETSLTGYAAEIQFCEVDPDLFAIVTGNSTVENADGDVIGFEVDTSVSLSGQGFSLEVWTDTATGDACENPDAEGSFGYVLFPFLKGGIVGDFTIENNAVTFTLTGATTRDGNNWGVGPYAVELGSGGTAGPLNQAVSKTSPLRVMTTGVQPPAPFCGCRPLLDPTVDALTSISAVVTGKSAAFTIVPDTIAEGVEYDFGDGTWDYQPGTVDVSHTYAVGGTYTARASSNGTWVTTSVVIAP